MNKNASSLATDAMAFGLSIRWRRITRGSAASRDVFLIPKICYIIRHCKFVSQGACIFLKKKKLKTTCQIGTKNPTTKKFIVEPSFFTSWTITSLNAHGSTCKKTKVYIYLNISLYENLFENGCIYTCIYIYIYISACVIFLKGAH